VARETGMGTRGRTMSEALPTMWLMGALPPRELLARALPRLRKKLPLEASKVGPPVTTVGLGWSYRISSAVGRRTVSDGQEVSTPQHPDFPDNERGKEPSQAYRQDLKQRADVTYVNLGTTQGSPTWSKSACDQCLAWDGAPVVVGGRESLPHGEGGQLGSVHVILRTKPEEGRMSLTKMAQKQKALARTACSDPAHRFTNLYSLLHWDYWIRCAADAVLARPGSSTAGVDGQTRDKFKANYAAGCVSMFVEIGIASHELLPYSA